MKKYNRFPIPCPEAIKCKHKRYPIIKLKNGKKDYLFNSFCCKCGRNLIDMKKKETTTPNLKTFSTKNIKKMIEKYGDKEDKFVVLNSTQYKNTDFVKHFKSAGIKVIKNGLIGELDDVVIYKPGKPLFNDAKPKNKN